MQPDLIFDIGMGNGDDTAHYISLGYRVVGVEADPARARAARRRFRDRDVTIVEAAISSEQGSAEFWVNEAHPDFSSLFRDVASRGDSPVRVCVSTLTLGELLASEGTPYYLKIDIEGADRYCLSGLVGRHDLPFYVSVEAHSPDYVDLLSAAGYRRFKLADQSRLGRAPMTSHSPSLRVLAWTDRQRGRLGRALRLPERYRYGSSGPFGEDTRGKWMSEAEILSVWPDIVRMSRGGLLAPSVWYDLHARLTPP